MNQIHPFRTATSLTALSLCLFLPSVQAANRTWSGAGADANWATAANWGGTAPANGDNLIFSGTTQQNNNNNFASLGAGFITFNNGGFTLNGNILTNAGSTTAFFTNTAGINTVACPLITTAPGGRYYFIAPGSELRLTGVITNPAAALGTSVGWLNLTNGGTVRIMNAARSTRGMDLFQGTVIVDGSSALVDALSDGLRFKPPTGSTVAVQITNNGTIRIGGGGNIRLGHNGTGIGGIAGAGSLSRMDISSGMLELYGTSVNILVGDLVAGATGIFNQNGGLVWGSAGSGNAITIGNSANADGTYNLNGGILWIAQVKQGNAAATNVVFNFNGGTLKPTGNSATFMQGLLTANILSGGAIIDTTNFNVTIGQQLGGVGGLTKLGSGTLALTTFDTYTGSTMVSNGVLALSSGIFGGGGSISVADGAGLSYTNSGGAFSCSSLTMGSTATNSLQFTFPSGNPGGASIVAGTFTGHGYVAVSIAGTGLTTGTFDLVDFTTGSGLSNFHLISVPPGVSANLVTTPTSLQLNISSVVKSLQWASTPADNKWNTTSLNWNDLGNGFNPTNYSQSGGFGDMVTFDGSATTAIDLPIVVTPVSITFDSSASSYQFTGVGHISGVGGITMSGFQPVTLGTSNDYSGGTIISSGTIYAGADQALGTGPVTLNFGTLASDSATARTLPNSILQNANIGVIFGDTVDTGPLTLTGKFDLGGGTSRTLNFNSDVIISGSLTNGGIATKTGPGALIIRGNSLQTVLATQQQGDVIIDGAQFISNDGWRMENTAPGSAIHLIVTNGGVFHASASVNTGNLRVGLGGGDNSASNIVDIVSGTIDLTPSTGVVNNNAVNVGGSGAGDVVYLRSGGLLITRELFGSAPSGTSDAHFMGGTMRPIANDTGFIQGLTNAFMEDGGLTIDTTNFSVTVPQALLVSGSGGLTKTGAGTLTLTGSNTYVGPTIVNAGKLILGPAHASTGNVTVNANSTLAFLQSAAPATVNLPSVTVGSGANSALEVQLTVTNAPAAIITNLVLNGMVAVNVSVPFGVGQTPLFGYGTISGSGGLTLGPLSLGTVAYLVTNVPNKTIDLVVSGISALTWTGTNNANWDTTTTNWTVLGVPVAYVQLANVLFNDSASNPAVNLTTTLTPNSMVVSNNALNYAFSGSGILSGNMTLVKDGTNTVSLNTANAYTGITTIKAGTVVMGNAAAFGAGTTNLTIQSGATLDINDNTVGASSLQPVVVSGSGVGGNGAIIDSGSVGQNNALRNVVLAGDTTIGGIGTIGLRTTATTDPGLIANGYKLTKVGNNQLNLNGGTTVAGITNTWFLDIGNIDIKQGTLSFQRHAVLGNPTNTVIVENGAVLLLFSLTPTNVVPTNSIVMTNGILAGTGGNVGDTNTLGGQITLNGAANIISATNGTFTVLNGPIVGTGGGLFNGTNILGGINTYSGSTVISNGWLALTPGASLTGTPSITTTTNGTLDVSGISPWTLGSGQTLAGFGTINGSVQANGTVSPGNSIGTLTFNNDLTLAGTTLMELNKSNPGQSNDVVAVSGTLTCGGNLSVVLAGGSLAAGDSFKLFNFGALAGSFSGTNLPAGYTWDASQLGANGIITVAAVTSRPHPAFNSVTVSGNSIILSGTNASGSYTLYSSTNLALPLANWTPVFTNSFGGSFSFTNIMAGPQKFYLLQ